jgi:DUF1680 family protein
MTKMSNMTRFIHFTQVRIDDPFWNERLRINRDVSIPCQYRHNRKTGRMEAFRLTWKPGQPDPPHIFWDSDVYKWLEAASYSQATHPTAEGATLLEEVASLIASAQEPDGYLNTYYQSVEPGKRWTNLRDQHELYCAGTLMEAGVAHHEATGSRTLLETACCYADYIDTVFGPRPEQKRGYCGHEEIELALVRLYHATGERRYLELARYFVEERGRQPHYFDAEARLRGDDSGLPVYAGHRVEGYAYYQAHLPVREQTTPVGHAVRAVYLYSAMADLAGELNDPTLIEACRTLWENLTRRRMYLTGGIGSARHNEGFTHDYDLPNATAYCETCAAVGLVFWSQRMLRHDCDRRYADTMERALYNCVLSGVSLDGTKFFYENPLASAGGHHRQEWFFCACCPANLSRLLASLGGYIFSETGDGLAVHLYIGGETEWTFGGGRIRVGLTTRYPWEGKVVMRFEVETPAEWTLRLRIPEWAASFRLTLGGEVIEPSVEKGYAMLRRTWRSGDEVGLELPLTPRRVYADPRVAADVGRVALQRGPLVYCVEDADLDIGASEVALLRTTPLSERWEAGFLGGVVVLQADGCAPAPVGAGHGLYADKPRSYSVPAQLKAVPYCTWDNRVPGAMAVWLPEVVS